MADAAIPYVSELLPGSPPFATQIFSGKGRLMRMVRVLTSGAMRVRSQLPADSYALVLDRHNGAGLHRSEKDSVFVNSQFAFIQSPLRIVEVLTPADFDVAFLRISRDGVVQELQKMLGREARTDLVFSPVCNMETVAGERLRNLCRNFSRLLCSTDQLAIRESFSVQRVEADIITLLLQAQPHNYTRLLNRQSAAGDWQLRTAEEYIVAHAHLSPSLGDICQAVGVNARTLQHSFRKKRGYTPLQFLYRIRMDGVRSGLQNLDNATSVTNEAARWGFLHFGRFAQEYRALFGELPSETLRRSQKT